MLDANLIVIFFCLFACFLLEFQLQEIDSASFLYYLDYCRVCKHNYKATPLREEENRGNNNHKKQKAATAEVVEVVLPPAAAIDTTTTIEEQPIAVAEDAPASSE